MLLELLFVCFGLLVCLWIYWYFQSFNDYEPNHGLKFELPPKEIYPFAHKWLAFELKHNGEVIRLQPVGHPDDTTLPCIHYIDVSSRSVKQSKENDACFLLCHGNPTWSFLYRKIIQTLCTKYRCVSIDCPGFGLSTAPKKYTFTTKQQAEILIAVIRYLKLKNIVLVQQDWGGPTGFYAAIKNAASIKAFVIGNTWCWRMSRLHRFDVYAFSCVFGGFFGRALGYGYNFVIRNFFREGFYKKLTPQIRYWYDVPFKRKNSRHGTFIYPAQIWDAHALLAEIERKVPEMFGKKVPCLLLWGTKDLAFKTRELSRFQAMFVRHTVKLLSEASHFWQEDQGEEAGQHIIEWMRDTVSVET